MLRRDDTLLVVVDVQEKLARAMDGLDALRHNLGVLLQGTAIMAVPALWTEQNPERLGATLPEVASLLEPQQRCAKMSFSCWAEPVFADMLRNQARRQVLLCGIEAHVCVYQTAADLCGAGYEVQIVADCVASRTPANRTAGLQKARDAGAGLTTAEIVLFELLRTAADPDFRAVSKVVK